MRWHGCWAGWSGVGSQAESRGGWGGEWVAWEGDLDRHRPTLPWGGISAGDLGYRLSKVQYLPPWQGVQSWRSSQLPAQRHDTMSLSTDSLPPSVCFPLQMWCLTIDQAGKRRHGSRLADGHLKAHRLPPPYTIAADAVLLHRVARRSTDGGHPSRQAGPGMSMARRPAASSCRCRPEAIFDGRMHELVRAGAA
jgi:hypothetical protein